MHCLIRTVVRRGMGGKAYRESAFHGETLEIGRAANQQVFLPDSRVALHHAAITLTEPGRYLLQARSGAGARVNGRIVQTAILSSGDTIALGGSTLTVVETESRLVVEVESLPQKAPPALPTEEKPRLGPVRTLSWLAFLGILGLFLAIPLFSVYCYSCYAPVTDALTEWLSSEEEMAELPELPWMISDRAWNSGEVASAHHFFKNDCATCHQKPFQRVTDTACTNCHRKTHPHVDPYYFDVDFLIESRCAQCHPEHNGRNALINREDTLCSGCHRDLGEHSVLTEVENASDFEHDHPEFKIRLIWHENGADRVARVAMDDYDQLVERSGLKFNHNLHLSNRGLATFDGIFYLGCEDCHTHKAGRDHLEPVEYEAACERCHPLVFEPSDDRRRVPHGKVEAVLFTLEEYYGNRALQGGYPDFNAPDVIRQERFPDEALTAEEQQIVRDWAKQKTAEISEQLFEFTGCVRCHEVQAPQNETDHWDVAPVRVNPSWFPKARFTHEAHKTMDCLFCHAAPESEVSSDILIPDLDTCRQCHGGVHSSEGLPTTCVDCHRFHVAEQFTMRNMNRLMGRE